MELELKTYSDPIYGDFKLNNLCDRIIEHQFFQRLKELNQLGLVNKRFSELNHTRYEHSIGVAYLSKLAIEELKKKHNYIPDIFLELVPLAGLLHDIGHGPQSHLFDKYLKLNGDNEYYDHENRSCKIFEYIVNNNEYLKDNLEKDDINFVCNMILGQITNKNINYNCIIELINNKESFFDLDKLDYLNRDSIKYNNNFNKLNYINIISGLKIINKNGLYELCHSINNKLEIERLFEQRFINHDRIYQDIAVKLWELSYLKSYNNYKNKILNVFNSDDNFNVPEFCKLNDESFKVIKCDYNIIGNKFEFEDPFKISEHLKNTELFCDDFNINYGAGNMNPVDKINFYDEVDKITFIHSDVSYNSYKKYEINYHYLYYDSNISNDIKLYEEIYDKLYRYNNSNGRLEKL